MMLMLPNIAFTGRTFWQSAIELGVLNFPGTMPPSIWRINECQAWPPAIADIIAAYGRIRERDSSDSYWTYRREAAIRPSKDSLI